MSAINARRVVLVAPINGTPSTSDFRVESYEIAAPVQGQFLVRNVYCSVDPGTRSRLSAGVSYTSNLKAGDLVSSFAMGRVVRSQHAGYSVGDWVVHASGWTDHQLCDGRGYIQKVEPRWTGVASGKGLGVAGGNSGAAAGVSGAGESGVGPVVPLSSWIGVLGIPGMTAWFGMTRVGALKDGDRVLVSSAAGPVGSSAGQIARLHGASRVVGIAGGPDKCAWLTSAAKFDAAIDYKAARAGVASERDYATRLQAELAAASPDGYDVFFDNVGNSMIDTVIPLLRPFSRIVISGTMADYNRAADEIPGLHNTRHFIAKRLRMEGILVFDDRKQFPAAQEQIAGWMSRGELVWREERFEGIDQVASAFVGLFTGESFGRRIVQLGPQEMDA